MKPVGLISTGVLLLLLGGVAPTYAQDEKHQQEAKPQKQEQQGKPARQEQQPQARGQQQQPQQQQQQHQHQQQEKPAQQQQQHQQPTNRTAQRAQQTYGGAYHGDVQPTGPTYGGVHHSGVPQQQAQVRSGFTQSRASSWSNDHRTWQQRGGYNGYRVPDDRFRSYFGNGHYFRISRLPLLYVGGYPRFQYDGYWVTFVDPWPESWPPTWYETDDVYVDYTDDGYYVYDRDHPGIAIAVTISF